MAGNKDTKNTYRKLIMFIVYSITSERLLKAIFYYIQALWFNEMKTKREQQKEADG